jgi:DNA-binding NtrC family response regulator
MKREIGEPNSNSAAATVSVLAVVTPAHGAELERIFSHTRWTFRAVHSVSAAVNEIRSNPASVILCEQRLGDGTWVDIVSEADRNRHRPEVIVLAPTADSRLWAEVVNFGGYDVLPGPIEARELYAVVSMAWRQWKHDTQADSKIELAEAHA